MKQETEQRVLSLNNMISQISNSLLTAAATRKSFIINDIPTDLRVNSNEQLLASVFGSMFSILIGNSECACIRISARVFGKDVIVHVRESQQDIRKTIGDSLMQTQKLAEVIGGNISITNEGDRTVIIVFNLSNNSQLAA